MGKMPLLSSAIPLPLFPTRWINNNFNSSRTKFLRLAVTAINFSHIQVLISSLNPFNSSEFQQQLPAILAIALRTLPISQREH
uniref:Uncharacterized protein n=1 Tax=Manihot esculenta TaxID=3983 RepID=A0A2C9VEK4_MANES